MNTSFNTAQRTSCVERKSTRKIHLLFSPQPSTHAQLCSAVFRSLAVFLSPCDAPFCPFSHRCAKKSRMFPTPCFLSCCDDMSTIGYDKTILGKFAIALKRSLGTPNISKSTLILHVLKRLDWEHRTLCLSSHEWDSLLFFWIFSRKQRKLNVFQKPRCSRTLKVRSRSKFTTSKSSKGKTNWYGSVGWLKHLFGLP